MSGFYFLVQEQANEFENYYIWEAMLWQKYHSKCQKTVNFYITMRILVFWEILKGAIFHALIMHSFFLKSEQLILAFENNPICCTLV